MSTAVGEQASGRVATVAQTAAAVRSHAGTRLLYMDNIRIVLTGLVVLVHLAITYGAPVGDWYYVEAGDVGLPIGVTMVLFVAVCQAFFMGMFFLFSAYLTPGSYERKGTAPFVIDRIKRLGIPLIVYAFVLNSLTDYFSAYPEGWFRGSLLDYIRGGYDEGPGVGPMWYVEALLIFTAVYVLWRLVARAASAEISVKAAVPRNRTLALVILGVAVASFVLRLWWPAGEWLEPVHFQVAHFAQYVTLFVAGIIAYRNDWLAKLTAAQARPWRWVALGLLPVFPALVLFTYLTTGGIDAFLGGPHWQSLVYALWEQYTGFAIILTLTAWFRERLNRQSALTRAMSGSTYAVYVTHPLTLVLLGWALSGVALPLAMKFVLVAPVAIALAFLVGYLVRRLPLAREVL